MKQKALSIAVLTAFFFATTLGKSALAELRILVSFDEAGQHLEQVIKLDNRSSFRDGDKYSLRKKEPVGSLAQAIVQMSPGEATLVWQGQNLEFISASYIADPRVIHLPARENWHSSSRLGSFSGAWLADGPANAKRVVVLLPENQGLGLAHEQWPFWLLP